jgi:catechol 2,3-dioxygenase-like lactoylglutathione lyase family enzyme
MRKTLLTVLLSAALMPAQTESPVVGVGPFLHMVSDLDQSLAFYRDKLGLELTGPAGEHKFTDNPAVANLYGVPGKQFRAAVLKIPGSPMGIELVQWGEARKPQAGPTAVTLMLRRPGAIRTTLVDPDGFTVEVNPSVIAGAALMIDVNDAGKAAALYESTLGLKSDQVRFTTAGNKPLNVPFPTPGQGMLRLFVRDIDGLTASLKSAGFSVITTGGVPVTLPQGPRVIILRDPNNFYWQLMETR